MSKETTHADLTEEDLDFLLTPLAQELLAAAPDWPGSLLGRLSRLRKRVSPAEAHAVATLMELRDRAAVKFSRGEVMYFTRAGLEQASGEMPAWYKAARFAGCERVADLCSGIGGDAIALAAVADVVACDSDRLATRLCELNAAAYDSADRIEVRCEDVTRTPLPADFLHMDPMRRILARKRIAWGEHQPPFSAAVELCQTADGAALKTAPSIPYTSFDPDCEFEFISEAGECKQAVLWFGALKRATRRAVVLPSEEHIEDGPVDIDAPGEPLRYIMEPDAAVIRAGLVQQLGARLEARQIDPQIAYLTADTPARTALAKCYEVQEVMPWALRTLKSYLHKRAIGHVTIKKRGMGVVPEEIRRRLRPKGDASATVILTRVLDRRVAIVTMPCG
jgi:THUMP domain-containing protein/RNA cap guanine-N2 methyltransferase